MSDVWTMEDVSKDFNAIAEAAYTGQPQYVTNGDNEDLVIIPKGKFELLETKKQAENKDFVEFLLSIPQGEPFIDEEGRQELKLRDVEF